METRLETLKIWLESSTKFFIDNYAEIFAVRSYSGVLQTDEEVASHRDGVSYYLYLERFIRIYRKTIEGAELSLKNMKRIENLPNFSTTHPNLLV